MLTPLDTAAALVVLAALFGYINHRVLKLPHSVGLMIIGALSSIALVSFDLIYPEYGLGEVWRGFMSGIDFKVTLMEGMLSFLLFAGALHVDLGDLMSRKWAVSVLATFGVLTSILLVGSGFYYLSAAFGLPVPFLWCLVFGALISPTDPIAVMSVLKRIHVPPSLQAKVAGESLFNDGVGVVMFAILLPAALAADAGSAESFDAIAAVQLFVLEAGGGALFGLLIGVVVYYALRGIDEHNLEVLLTLALVMGGYALAHRLHVSGPVAMAVAGLLIGNHGVRFAMSDKTREHVTTFWSLIDETLNSILFLLLGLEGIAVSVGANVLALAGISIALVLAARAASVGLPLVIMGRLKPFSKGAYPILVWGGIRGGISIALALSLPDGELKDVILTVAYAIVLFSVIVQGTTIGLLARRVLADESADDG